MSCRCTDKANCKSDIYTIEQILSVLSDSDSTNSSVLEEHNNLSSSSVETFTTINMGELNNAEMQLNRDVSEIIPDLITRCKQKIEDLEREYESLRREDESYHRRKSRHHHSH